MPSEFPVNTLATNVHMLTRQVVPGSAKDETGVRAAYLQVIDICTNDVDTLADHAKLRYALQKLAKAVDVATADFPNGTWNRPFHEHIEQAEASGVAPARIDEVVTSSMVDAVLEKAELVGHVPFHFRPWSLRSAMLQEGRSEPQWLAGSPVAKWLRSTRSVVGEVDPRAWTDVAEAEPSADWNRALRDARKNATAEFVRDITETLSKAVSEDFAERVSQSDGFSKLVRAVAAANKLGADGFGLLEAGAQWIAVNDPKTQCPARAIAYGIEKTVGDDRFASATTAEQIDHMHAAMHSDLLHAIYDPNGYGVLHDTGRGQVTEL